jgi:hypothetical protein
MTGKNISDMHSRCYKCLIDSLFNRTLARVLLKIFLNLTKPIDSTRRKSLESTIRPRKSSESKEEALARQNKEKDIQNNTYEQVTALLHFKECLLNGIIFTILFRMLITNWSL